MRLREIKTKMAVHCVKREEIECLFENKLIGQGVATSNVLPIYLAFSKDGFEGWMPEVGGKEYFEREGYKVIEFSDLIIPELSAEEVLNICHQICEEQNGCDNCFCEKDCFADRSSDARKIIEICEQWKADHKKKEPELEWVDICRIIEIQSNGFKKCVHEEDMIPDMGSDYIPEVRAERFLFDYISSHDGNYIAVVERVCRVKK